MFKTFLLLFFASNFVSIVSSLDGGSFEWQNNWYFLQSEPASFDDAELDCVSLGGHLVSIHNWFENVLLHQKSINYFRETIRSIWIGLVKTEILENWKWTDYTQTHISVNFTKWQIGGSENFVENRCATLSLITGNWESEDCKAKNPYICKVNEKNPPPQWPPMEASTESPIVKPIDSNCTSNRKFQYYEPTHSCYGFVSNRRDWLSGQRECEKYGGNLPSVHSDEELKFLQDLFYGGFIQLSGYLSVGATAWKWNDGTQWDYGTLNTNTTTPSCAAIDDNALYEWDCFHRTFVYCQVKV